MQSCWKYLHMLRPEPETEVNNGRDQLPIPVPECQCRPDEPRPDQTRPNQTKGKKFARKAFKNVPINCTKKGWDDFVSADKKLKMGSLWDRFRYCQPRQMAKWGSAESAVLPCALPVPVSIVMGHLWKSRDWNLCNSLTKWVKCFKIWQLRCNCIKTINNLMTATSGPYNIHTYVYVNTNVNQLRSPSQGVNCEIPNWFADGCDFN